MDGPRHVWWNFVPSSRKERIEAAKADWKAGTRFPRVPGDESEFIPLPEMRVQAASPVQAPSAGSPTS